VKANGSGHPGRRFNRRGGRGRGHSPAELGCQTRAQLAESIRAIGARIDVLRAEGGCERVDRRGGGERVALGHERRERLAEIDGAGLPNHATLY
jgi:hypothetical protein